MGVYLGLAVMWWQWAHVCLSARVLLGWWVDALSVSEWCGGRGGWLVNGLPGGKGKRGVYDGIRGSGVPGGVAAAVLGSAVAGTQAAAQTALV
jgi:hypothetical protein